MSSPARVAGSLTCPLDLLQAGQYKLCDFGLAVMRAEGEGLQTIDSVGDRRYLPAEALDDRLSRLTAIDMFSLGITIYELFLGKTLPDNPIDSDRIRNGCFVCFASNRTNCLSSSFFSQGDIDQPKNMPDFLFPLVRALLHREPNMRPTGSF